eukprot:232204_1
MPFVVDGPIALLSWLRDHSYPTFACAATIGLCLYLAQKTIERVYRFQFKTCDKPDHLIVVQHGFGAPWLHSYPLGKWISKLASRRATSTRSGGYLIHVIRSNSRDYVFGLYATCLGIERGGQRTLSEIKSILHDHPSITKISLIGSSLGGLYVREVAKQLYNPHTHSLYNNLLGMNFVTLATPHLGVVKKINQTLVRLAKIAYLCHLLPKTLVELLGFGADPLLKKMARDKEYLKPLQLFANKVIYANTINDNRVSLSSGLIIPSFEYEDEEEFVKQTYLEDIEYSRSNKQCIIKPFGQSLCTPDEVWYDDVMNDAMKWKRFVVSMNTNFISKCFAHELLSHPLPSVQACEPVLEHLSRQLRWE